MPLDPKECASPFSSNIICSYYAKKTIKSASIGNFHYDYYPSLNVLIIILINFIFNIKAIIIGGNTINSNIEFNYYIPVKITGAINYGFLSLISNY